jgi:branched-chain amino acid transport system permease protein
MIRLLKQNWGGALVTGVVILLLAAMPAMATPFLLRVGQAILFGAALAMAWNILGGFAGYWSFGNAAFLGLGAFAAGLLQEHGAIADPQLRFLIGVLSGGLAAALLGAVIGYPILRLRGTYFAIAMLGVSLVLSELSSSIDLFEGALGITIDPITDLAPDAFFFYAFLVLAAFVLIATAVVRYSRLGYGLIAIREDEDTARMLGIPTERYKMFAFVLSAALTGLAGAIYAFSLGYITTNSVFRTDLSLNMIVYSLLGGMGTLLGPVLGAALMAFLTQVVLGDFLQIHMMLTGAIIILFVFVLPKGIMGALPSRKRYAGEGIATGELKLVAGERAHAQWDESAAPLLSIRGLCKHFRGLKAIDGVDIDISKGSISTIIGPNGAGKSTVFNMVTGYFHPTAGEIWYRGNRIDGLATYKLSQLGVARVFQIAKPFHGLSVYENVLVGALFGQSGPHNPMEVAVSAMKLAGLQPLAGELASSLPVGHLRRLEIARAMATRPHILLADEPCAGLNPTETQEMTDILSKIRDQGTTVVLVEHDMETVMKISDKVFVISAGKLIAAGEPRQVVSNPAVIEAYLGKPLDTLIDRSRDPEADRRGALQ